MILDLFAGPGGWSEGLRALGLSDVGIEWDRAACLTRAAAGHSTIRADVAQYPCEPFVGKVRGLIASPPCQDFSVAGKRAGIDGDKGQLIAQVPRWVDALRPEWVACEQVPPCVDIWHDYADLFRSWGYSAWAGVLNAADFGVPQTRKRAFLIASRVGAALPPEPTHARTPEVGLFATREPWVTMAQALGWGMDRRPSVTVAAGSGRQGGPAPLDGGAGSRATLKGAQERGEWVLRNGAQEHATVRTVDEPAPTIFSSMDNGDTRWLPPWRQHRNDQTGSGETDLDWPLDRPATTLASRDLVPDPGANANRFNGNAKSRNDGIKITVQEALTLQSFDAAYPVQGTKSKQFEQVGNAVPPRLAAHVIASLVGLSVERAA